MKRSDSKPIEVYGQSFKVSAIASLDGRQKLIVEGFVSHDGLENKSRSELRRIFEEELSKVRLKRQPALPKI